MDLLVSKNQANTLTQLEHRLADKGAATVILFEGEGGMAMSHVVNQIVAIFEPRNIKYHCVGTSNLPWIKYCLTNVAPKGTISIFDRGWYTGFLTEDEDKLSYNINLANSFERYLYNNGVNVIKIFLEFDKDSVDKYEKSYPVSLDGEDEVFNDIGHIKQFSISKTKIRRLLNQTNTKYAKWDVIHMTDFKETVRNIADLLGQRFTENLSIPSEPETFEIVEHYHNPREEVDFTKSISKEDYEKKLAKLQKKLAELQIKLAKSDKAMVLVFEGWDAAGKGGCIKRLTQSLNPRGYKVFPTPAPTAEEKQHTHLWRFVKNIPDPGKIAIFDRSWYGRMMVEPIEGFCTEEEYSRAAGEINLFEDSISKSHVIILKFWVDITKDEQLKRFNDRAANPLKQWKLTDEDWRNREKWDVYERYVNSMIRQTNTPYAPWIDVECVDKRYGRIKILETIVNTLKKELD